MAKRPYGLRAAESRGPTYATASSDFQASEDIVPIAELKVRLSEIVRSLEERQRPLVITLNGKSAAVLMSPRAYDRIAYHARVASQIEQGLEDTNAGRTISDQKLGRRVAKRYRVPSGRRK